jgi:hypothetical protein
LLGENSEAGLRGIDDRFQELGRANVRPQRPSLTLANLRPNYPLRIVIDLADPKIHQPHEMCSATVAPTT